MSIGHFDPRLADVDDSGDIARLLHDFNTEYGVSSPGPDALRARLEDLLAADSTFAVIAGSPPSAVAVVTLRPNVWYAGPVALLDEMYVEPNLRGQGVGAAVIELSIATCTTRGVELIEINVDEGDIEAQRFYRRHGFVSSEPGSAERSFYFRMELGSDA